MRGVSRGVDVEVRKLLGQEQHFVDPRCADVTADDHEFGEFEQDRLQVGDRPAGLGGAQWTGVSDLRAERDAEFDSGLQQWIVAAVVRRQVPQPRHDAQRDHTQIGYRAA